MMIVINGEDIDKYIQGGEDLYGRVNKLLLRSISEETSRPTNQVNEVWDMLYEGMRGNNK